MINSSTRERERWRRECMGISHEPPKNITKTEHGCIKTIIVFCSDFICSNLLDILNIRQNLQVHE